MKRKSNHTLQTLITVITCLLTLGMLSVFETVNPASDISFNHETILTDVVLPTEELIPMQSEITLEEKINLGTAYSNQYGYIDWSADGSITVCYIAESKTRLKCTVTGPTTSYAYDLHTGIPANLSLTDGNGKYDICLLENVQDNTYRIKTQVSVEISLSDAASPYLASNMFVNWEDAPAAVQKAEELTAGLNTNLEKVSAIYNYVVENTVYDNYRAETVQPGYLPDLDSILAEKKGICLDYASLVAGMLRSQGIPCKLVVGYAGDAYHAWVSVWSDEDGWVDDNIHFSQGSWERMDPTFASSGKNSDAVLQYIGDGTNYSPSLYY